MVGVRCSKHIPFMLCHSYWLWVVRNSFWLSCRRVAFILLFCLSSFVLSCYSYLHCSHKRKQITIHSYRPNANRMALETCRAPYSHDKNYMELRREYKLTETVNFQRRNRFFLHPLDVACLSPFWNETLNSRSGDTTRARRSKRKNCKEHTDEKRKRTRNNFTPWRSCADWTLTFDTKKNHWKNIEATRAANV